MRPTLPRARITSEVTGSWIVPRTWPGGKIPIRSRRRLPGRWACFRLLILALALLFAPRHGGARSQSAEDPPRTALAGDENDNLAVSLGQARELLRARLANRKTEPIGPVSLAGFNWARELQVSPTRVVLAISCNLGGGMILFDERGRELAFRRTYEIRPSITVTDIDGSGTLAVVTEERDGVGTGFQEWYYRIYLLAADRITPVWHGESYFAYSNALSGDQPTERLGFFWLGPSDGELWHLVRDRTTGCETVQHYQLRDGSVAPWRPPE